MAKVPYSPVPEVGLKQIATPQMRIDSPVAAFGGASAAAMGDIGQAVSRAGDQVFTRAMALQQLENDAAARDAATDYMIEAGNLEEQYKTLNGKAAKDAYPKYQDDLRQTRERIRGTLTNPSAEKVYDNATMQTMALGFRTGARYAATENKQYLKGSHEARIAAVGDQALANPLDEGAFRIAVEDAKAQSVALGNMDGWSPEQQAQHSAETVSNLWAKRIVGLAKTQPFAAEKMMKAAFADGSLRGADQQKVMDVVRTQTRSVGARGISNDINSGKDLFFGSSVVSTPLAKQAMGTYESGNDYSAIGPMTKKAGRALGKYQVMEKYLPDYLARAGLPAMTPEQFLKSPDAQEKVFERTFVADMQKYGSFNEAASRWFTGKSVAEARADYERYGTTDATPGRKGTNINQYLQATNAILARNAPLSAKVARGEEMAKTLAPDDQLMPDYTRQRVEADEAQFKRVREADKFEAKQTVTAGILGGGKDGKIPTTLDELFEAMPGSAEAWARLDPTVQGQLLQVMKRNARGDVAWTPEGNSRYDVLYGKYKSGDPEFLNLDMAAEDKLPLSARRELAKYQQNLRANPAGDPRVSKAEGLIRDNFSAQLQALGIYGKSQKNKEDYSKYVGALSIALDNYLEQNKKPASDQVILKEIAPQVLQTAKSSYPWPFNGETPYFTKLTTDVPKEFTAQIEKAAQAGGQEMPSQASIQRMYMRYQWRLLNESKGQKAQ